MNIGETYEAQIEKLTNTGAGLTRIDGIVVFIENVCPEDYVKIKIDKINKNYAKGSVIEILKPSTHRTQPFCPMQRVCGACQLQFIDYNYQLEIKQQIVKETMKSIANIDIEIPLPIPSPKTKEFRHKIQYPVTETKNSKRILAGYYKVGTHEIVNIKYCPIQSKICDKIIDFIRENANKYGICGYFEKKHTGDLKHIVIRESAFNKDILVTLVVNSKKSWTNLEEFSKALYREFEQIKGVCINFNPQKTNVIMGDRTLGVCGQTFIKEQILDKKFKISANTFFQVNPASATNIFKYVKDYIKKRYKGKANVLDAYAGISAFGISISDACNSVVTVEENIDSVKLAKESVKINQLSNIEIHCQDAGEFFRNEKREFDAVILDPPRKGCTTLSLDEAYRLAKDSIIYVSCNPATLARDLKYLKEKGATIKNIQPFDMFCHSTHIENVAIIIKK